MRAAWVIPVLLLPGAMGSPGTGSPVTSPGVSETVAVPSGTLRLTALVWRPAGVGPFPAVLFNHGSGPTDPSRAQVLGPLFAGHGYVFLYLFRRGDGLSAGQGSFMGDLLDHERAARGEEGRNRLQELLLTTDQLDDVRAGVSFLKAMPEVDPGRVAVAGHSFGAQLALLAAESDSALRAAVCFAPAAVAWGKSSELRDRLLEAARRTKAPILLVYAANDFSITPGLALASELRHAGKPGGLKIVPAVGRSADEGHDAVYRATSLWEEGVFEFLDRSAKR